jgi:hypothetical protein
MLQHLPPGAAASPLPNTPPGAAASPLPNPPERATRHLSIYSVDKDPLPVIGTNRTGRSACRSR